MTTFALLFLLGWEVVVVTTEAGLPAARGYFATLKEKPPADVPFGIGFDTLAVQAQKDRAAFFKAHRKENGVWVPVARP